MQLQVIYNLPTKEFNEIDYTFEVKKQKVRNIEIAYIDEGKSDEVFIANSRLRYKCEKLD